MVGILSDNAKKSSKKFSVGFNSDTNNAKVFFDKKQAKEHLLNTWGIYENLSNACFSLYFKGETQNLESAVKFCIEPIKDMKLQANTIYAKTIDELIDKAVNHVEKMLRNYGIINVYASLNPVENTGIGRGTSKDVKAFKFLWLDIDYKEKVVDEKEMEFEGCRELDDFALKCYFRVNNKVYKFERPPLSEIYDRLTKLGIPLPTYVIDSGRGYHLYWLLDGEHDPRIEPKKGSNDINIAQLERNFVDVLSYTGIPVDTSAKDPVRMLRLPGTINPKNGRMAKIIVNNGVDYSLYSPYLFKKVIERINKEKINEANKKNNNSKKAKEDKPISKKQQPDDLTVKQKKGKKLRRLTKEEKRKLYRLIKRVYKEGHRDNICRYLAGYCANKKIHPISCADIIVRLYNKLESKHLHKDTLAVRLHNIVYTYKKKGINTDKYNEIFQKRYKVTPYGANKDIPKGAIKGRSGLEKEFIDVFIEELKEDNTKQYTEKEIERIATEKAYSLLHEIDKVIKGKHKSKEENKVETTNTSTLKLFVVNKGLRQYVFIDPETYACGYAKLNKKGEIETTEPIINAIPQKIEILSNPILQMYKIPPTTKSTWLRLRTDPNTGEKKVELIELDPGTIEDIHKQLDHNHLLRDDVKGLKVLRIIISDGVKEGWVTINNKYYNQGFFYDLETRKIIVVNYDITMPSKEEVNNALSILEKIINIYYQESIAEVVNAVLLDTLLPFNFAIKTEATFNGKQRWLPNLFIYGPKGTGKTTLLLILLHIWGVANSPLHRLHGSKVDSVAKLGRTVNKSTLPMGFDELPKLIEGDSYSNTIKGCSAQLTVRDISQDKEGKYTWLNEANFIATTNMLIPQDDALGRRFFIISLNHEIPEERQRKFHNEIEPQQGKLAVIGKVIANEIVNHPELIINETVIERDWHNIALELMRRVYEYAGREMPEFWYTKYESEQKTKVDKLEMITALIKKAVIDIFNKRSHERDMDYKEMFLKTLMKGWLDGLELDLPNLKITTTFMELYINPELPNMSLKEMCILFSGEYKSIRVKTGVTTGCLIDAEKFVAINTGTEISEEELSSLDDYTKEEYR